MVIAAIAATSPALAASAVAIDIRGVEKRDDSDGADVVDDRDRHVQELDRCRHTPADQRENAEREGNVGRRRYGPPADQCRIGSRDEQKEERGHRHSGRRRDHRKAAGRRG
jgi:hypothetical protein